jgi:hypothetical protein
MSHVRRPVKKGEKDPSRSITSQAGDTAKSHRHTTHPSGACLSSTFLMLNSRKSWRPCVAGHPLADFGAAPPSGRLVRVPGEIWPKFSPAREESSSAGAIRRLAGQKLTACLPTPKTVATTCSRRRRLRGPAAFRDAPCIEQSPGATCERRVSATGYESAPPSWTAGSGTRRCRLRDLCASVKRGQVRQWRRAACVRSWTRQRRSRGVRRER